jgi:hypothetical protein
MAAEELVTIAKYSDPHEAGMVRAMLESHGIDGLLIGGEINNTLWPLGATIAGVELRVPESQSVRAVEILETHREGAASAAQGDWTCLHCGEDVEAGFDVCWSCQTPFDATPPDPADDSPARPPLDDSGQGLSDDDIPSPASTTDELASRALRAALVGILFFPAMFYCLFLLLELGSEELSESALKKFYWSTGLLLVWLTMFVGLLLGI